MEGDMVTMEKKLFLRAIIRGWLPKEPTLLAHHKPLAHVPYMVWWLAAGVGAGAGAVGVLVLFGDLTGITSTYAAFFWYIEVAFVAWCIGGFIAIYGYFRHKRSHGAVEA